MMVRQQLIPAPHSPLTPTCENAVGFLFSRRSSHILLQCNCPCTLILDSITRILHTSMLPKPHANTTAFLSPWQIDASSRTKLSRKLSMTTIVIVGRGILPQLVRQPCGCCPSLVGHSRAQLVTLPHLSRIEHTKHCYPVIAHAFFFSSVSHFKITLFYLHTHTLPKPSISHRLRHVQLHHQSRLLAVLQ